MVEEQPYLPPAAASSPRLPRVIGGSYRTSSGKRGFYSLATTFHGLPEDEIGKMLDGNAAEFYGVDTEKLAPLVARIGPEKSAFQ